MRAMKQKSNRRGPKVANHALQLRMIQKIPTQTHPSAKETNQP
jgi:hypothetical protein